MTDKLMPQTKKYLRQQIVLTDFEQRQHLKQRRLQLFQTIAELELEIKSINVKLERKND